MQKLYACPEIHDFSTNSPLRHLTCCITFHAVVNANYSTTVLLKKLDVVEKERRDSEDSQSSSEIMFTVNVSQQCTRSTLLPRSFVIFSILIIILDTESPFLPPPFFMQKSKLHLSNNLHYSFRKPVSFLSPSKTGEPTSPRYAVFSIVTGQC